MKLTEFPQLVKEWHPTKNVDLTPEDVTHGSARKVWWLCPKGHSYKSSICNRTRANPSGCPYCSGRKIGEDNNLQSIFPDIAKEWHSDKNGKLSPKNISSRNDKKVWWLCPKGHSYYSSIGERTRKDKPTGCPYCAGKKVDKENNLQAKYPEIAKEWHPTKNGGISPSDVTRASSKKAWWLCPKKHSYQSIIANRTRQGVGCPYCAGKKASPENNLRKLFPGIAKEWHPTKNGKITPENVTYGSHKKVWWRCPRGHSYQAIVKSRTNKQQSGCPKCSNQSSEPEVRIFSELQWVFNKVYNRHKINSVEVDVFLPEYNLAVEYDGNYWHRNKEQKDLEKNEFLSSLGIILIRVRQSPLKPISENDIVFNDSHSLRKKDVDAMFKKINSFVDKKVQKTIDRYLQKKSFANEELFQQYRSYLPSPIIEKSLLKTHPEESSEWDYEKNTPLKPENFSYGSNTDVWWICQKGHSYKSSIYGRICAKLKCPYCLGKKSLTKDLFD